MSPAVYDSAIGAGVFWAIVWGWQLLEVLQSRREVKAETDVDRDRGSGRRIMIVTWIAIPGAFGLAHVDFGRIPGDRWLVWGIGTGLLVAGIAFRQWSIRVLGRHFRRKVTIQAGHEVIRRGPYRFLRHPAYAGSLAAVLGMGVAFGNWPALALAVVPTTFVVVQRIRVEEAALEAALGEPYRQYERSTSRLVPGIW